MNLPIFFDPNNVIKMYALTTKFYSAFFKKLVLLGFNKNEVERK